MNKKKLIAGIILFGSLWGFSETIIGSYINDYGMPSGAIMTGIFAIGFMMISRLLYKQRGMQIGMGLVAGTLRLFNPFVGCFICSAFAIMAEGLIFELLWYKLSLDLKELKPMSMKLSMGIISGYICFTGGFIVTQILTPIVSSAGFHIQNLIVFLPQILSRGLLAAIISGIALPTIFILKNIDISKIKDRVYYPTTATITIFCWVAVILNTIIMIS